MQSSLTAFYTRDESEIESLGKDVRIVSGFRIGRGSPLPLGPDRTARGVNFAVYAGRATKVFLELYDGDDDEVKAIIELDPRINRTGEIWHVRVLHPEPERLRPLRYLWKADGPRDPSKGLYYDPNLPLLDPYARAFSGVAAWGRPDLPHPNGGGGPAINPRRCRIAASRSFDWDGDVPLLTPIEDSVIYELHVRGFTVHESSGVSKPGSFIGLTEKIPYLLDLGVTAVELMPVFEFDENENMRKHPRTGEPLLNYWGYSPIGFFSPNTGYAADAGDAGVLNEFREMVRRFHKAGLEVYLDVVFNHTAEGDERGPTISFRGLDNPTYYMLDRDGRYRNFSGCGNTFNCNHPVVRNYIIDVLHYWTAVMHIDGFRFDLASILGRDVNGEVLANPPILERISKDPILANTKLIAEAWDAAGLNQVGNFPSYGRWSEWNGYYRDDVRMFWRGDPGLVSRFASRVCGSDDLYSDSGGTPRHTINFVTAHDGFTLNDLVSYEKKHNEDNGEGNRDGEDYNHSMNFGVEGPTGDAEINRKRGIQMKNYIATLMLSQGVPMLLGGDEFRRTQKGNNNAYCQDNEISWVDWRFIGPNADMIRFVRLMIAFRRDHPILRRKRFFSQGGGITWHGERENEPDWSEAASWLAFLLDGGQAKLPGGGRDDDIYVMMNASAEWRHFAVPGRGGEWRKILDTSRPSPEDIYESIDSAPSVGERQDRFAVEPRSVVVLVNRRG
ncbi:MAG: glycogen debranching protein GlgX [Planctomycetota bacterium]|jgi:glycogen operon protein|nr:glycogen debranching protein GlgX [Planctomycetota bacterium]